MDGGFCQGAPDEIFWGSCLSGKRLTDAGGALRGGSPQRGHVSSMFITMFHGSSFAPAATTHHTFCDTTGLSM